MADVPAVLFDVDGTLVDSNYLHVYAWTRAFQEAGIAVESWRIHRSIGMDGTRLIQSLSGDADDDAQKKAEDLHTRYLKEAAPLLRPLPGARELLKRVSSLGLQVVLASSASEDELSMSREVLDSDDLVSAATSSKDVDVAKPEPTIIEIALDRAGVDADHAVYVGRRGVGRHRMRSCRSARHRAPQWRSITRGTREGRRQSRFRQSARPLRSSSTRRR